MVKFSAVLALSVAFLTSAASICGVTAAEVRVVANDAVRKPMLAITSKFEKDTTHSIVTTYGPANSIEPRLTADPRTDIVFWSLSELNNLVRAGRIAPDYPKVVGRVRIGIAHRVGTPKPDVSSVAKLRAVIEATPSFAYGNPKSGVPTDAHVVRMLEELRLDKELREKGVMREGGVAVLMDVADRRAALGFAQASEIAAFPGVALAGFMPDSVQLTTVHAAALTKTGKENPAAVELFKLIIGEPASYVFERSGFDIRR
jgi:molybdate transport system substrate-binding protein